MVATREKPAKAQKKEVQVVSRKAFESGYVRYEVRSSNGFDTYAVTLRDGKALSCECNRYGSVQCYHKSGCEELEAAFTMPQKPAIQQETSENGATVWYDCEVCWRQTRNASRICGHCLS